MSEIASAQKHLAEFIARSPDRGDIGEPSSKSWTGTYSGRCSFGSTLAFLGGAEIGKIAGSSGMESLKVKSKSS